MQQKVSEMVLASGKESSRLEMESSRLFPSAKISHEESEWLAGQTQTLHHQLVARETKQ